MGRDPSVPSKVAHDISARCGVSTAETSRVLRYLQQVVLAPREDEPSSLTYGDLVARSVQALVSVREEHRAALSSGYVPPAFPSHVQIQTIGGCNASCIMCAMSSPKVRRYQRGRMSDDLFGSLIDECAAQPSCEEIALYLQNEPLLDPDIAARVRLVKDRGQGRLSARISTNGSLLSDGLVDELILAGLDRIAVSLNAFTKHTYAQVMGGLDFDVTMRGLERLLDRAPSHMLVTITFMATSANEHEIEEAIDYWSGRGVLCGAYGINTMSGAIPNFDTVRASRHCARRKECYLPLESAAILSSGDVLLCCADWDRLSVCGNVVGQGLREVWRSNPLARLRRDAIQGRFNHEVCQKCLGQTRLPENLICEGGPGRARRR